MLPLPVRLRLMVVIAFLCCGPGRTAADHRIRHYRGATERLPSNGVLEYRILGPLEVVGDRGPLRLGGPKQRATLAILLLSANRVVSIERLAEDLYSGATPVTAVTQVQRQISELRKVIGPSSGIETRSPGYVIRLSRDQLDLSRFERSTEDAIGALTRGDATGAVDLLRRALGLWRGAALADLAYEAFAQVAINRLEEIRLAALEQRIEADLMLGRHAELVGELEELVDEHPLREHLCRQLMLALYRSGRQAEALDVYRRTRAVLVDQFGIEPTPPLHALERAILAQDPSLDLEGVTPAAAAGPGRALLVLPSTEDRLDGLLAVAEPLAKLPGRELIIGRLLAHESELGPAVSALNARRAALEASARTAVFTTLEPARDIVRLATIYDVELVLLDAPPDLDANSLPDELASILERSPADVAVLMGSRLEPARGAGVFVPFGGGQHDWAALELGAWLSSATRAPLRLVGTGADPRRGQRDASRLLADASLAVQRVVGVETEPVLAEPTEEALLGAVDAATMVVVGISPRWREDGIGEARRALVRGARAPMLLVHSGPRPGGLAPRGSGTRFSWSIEPALESP
jgi:DNA-binding SARP family transcriptional activator